MQIKLAKTAGFCFGVNRAVELLYDKVEAGERVCTLGPIIHNAQLVGDLAERGVKIIDRVEDCPPGIRLWYAPMGWTSVWWRKWRHAICPLRMLHAPSF